MHFEWTVNVGNVLTAGLLLIGFIKAHIQNVERLKAIEEKVGLMYRWFTRRMIRGGADDND